jgi:hypothetical protein
MIDELVFKVADKIGLSPDQARTGLSAALALIQKHGEPAKVEELFATVPGASQLAVQGQAMTAAKTSGLMGGLMRAAGGGSGAAMADAMQVGQKLAREGVTTSDMQALLPIAMDFVKEKAGGRDLLREVLGSIPGIGKLLIGD